ncbi:MAG: winged helix DNA-binding domain-containing protein [Bacteroidales bacterium]|nr:winged helix DNA-binding domain-containing protein [Bacteroidales bacterium]
MNPISIRLLNQQLVAPRYSKPEEVVAHFGAMQAQEYRLMRWAVAMRTAKPSEKAFVQAFNQGKIVRLHLLRGTWQLVSAQDYWWMLDLCASKARKVISGWMSANKITIPDTELYAIREILVEAADKKDSVTKEDFEEALASKGIAMDSHRLSYHIRFAELEGILCSGSLLPMKATYALSSKKIATQEPKSRDESLMLLTHKYFQSHQPATLEDFVWWSGLGINDCKKGIELLGNSIHSEHYQGREFYLLDNCRTRGFRKGEYLLMAPYDEYLIGYKSRDIVLNPEYKHHAHNNSGIFQPIIAHDGIICGNWTPFKKEPDMSFFLGQHDAENLKPIVEKYNKYRLPIN